MSKREPKPWEMLSEVQKARMALTEIFDPYRDWVRNEDVRAMGMMYVQTLLKRIEVLEKKQNNIIGSVNQDYM